MFIYIIKNIVNGKYYVGKTMFPINHRWSKHLNNAFNKNLYCYNFIF